MENENLFWNASIEELKQGYVFKESGQIYHCLFCNMEFKKGIIYKADENYMDADFAARHHIKEKHDSPFNYFLSMDKKNNGLSDIQKEIIRLMFDGLSDNEIAGKLNNKSNSTIRNHRFVLREKYKEAKIFIAIMELFEERIERASQFVNFHASIPVKDERTMTTEKEKEEILVKYFEDSKLTSFPKKEKKKLIILQQIAKKFEKDKTYHEKEINEILKDVYFDYVTIRRYLIEYGFLDRVSDGSKYWLK